MQERPLAKGFVWALGFRVLRAFKVSGFSVLGFRLLGLEGIGFSGFGVSGV